MNKIISNIQELFLKEAESSPLLFSDLANLEKYISESYAERSLIELLQNADDARATSFCIKKISKCIYLVANNGREFTNEDMLALCRSGASTKKRKSNTIGFRGIGFKSVVGYAEKVHLISGDIKTTFSKSMTQDLCNIKDVPLVRIPHEFAGDEYWNYISQYQNAGYRTVFIFETKNDSLEKEIKVFDGSCTLFLNSISRIEFNILKPEIYSIQRNKVDNTFNRILIKNNTVSGVEWITTIPTNDAEKCSIAFTIEEGKAKKINAREAVAHSFMPTKNLLSFGFKVNGDFSTDPSRTKVVIDEESQRAALSCAKIISNLLIEIISTKEDKFGILKLIKDAKIDPLSNIRGADINDIIVEKLQTIFSKTLTEMNGGKEIFVQPVEVSDDDFQRIISHFKVSGYGNELEKKLPDILKVLKTLGIKELPSEKIVGIMKEQELSEHTRINVAKKLVNQYKFSMDEKVKKDIAEAKLFTFNSGVKRISEVSKSEVVSEKFEGAIIESLTSSSDYGIFTKKMGLGENQLAINQRQEKTKEHIFNKDNNVKIHFSGKQSPIKKWRSVEENMVLILQTMKGVKEVHDVAARNMGYDLEVIFEDGKRNFYEVKSVDQIGDLISITNNEYSAAAELKNSYYLTIVSQSEEVFEICFIKNPTDTLNLNRRITRWEWTCEGYTGEVVKYEI